MNLGNNLKEARKKSGLSQDQYSKIKLELLLKGGLHLSIIKFI